MACFSLVWLKDLLIWFIVIAVVWAVIKLLLPMILTELGISLGNIGNTVLRILWLIFIGFVLIFVVVLAFDLISCFLGASGGLSFPRSGRG